MRYWCPTTEVTLLVFFKTIKHRDHKEIAESKVLTKKREKRIYADSNIPEPETQAPSLRVIPYDYVSWE